MAAFPYTVVDAFTERPFAGNPAAVLVLDSRAEPAWMQLVAGEFDLPETAFTYPDNSGDGRAWRLRWFTPTVEVDACGHATLATAHALFRQGRAADSIDFDTRSGRLTCRHEGDRIVMDWPADPCGAAVETRSIAETIGAPVRAGGAGRNFTLAEVDDAETVRKLTPDLTTVARLQSAGLIVTAPGDGGTGGAHVVSRVFAPQSGIPEDPVTGSAHCCLAPWWASRAGDHFLADQLSARGGRVEVRDHGDRVELLGNAVTVAEGRLLVDH